MSERLSQEEGRWKGESYKKYTAYTVEDARRVSRKLGDRIREVGRQPGKARYGVARRGNGIHTISSISDRPRNGRVPFGDLVI